MASKRKSAGLTPRQIETIGKIERERGLELPEGWEKDVAYGEALLDCLAIDRQERPLKEVARFVNNLVVEVEQGATVEELKEKYRVPAKLALTLHRYALKQLGWRGAEEWFSDRQRLNQAIEENDGLAV
ncbi:MAG: hypothetical protein FJX55_03135 [Alphaproteobacteria bacterium]|nr:hypothetical protein [Alphaproteobacteria bacterium]